MSGNHGAAGEPFIVREGGQQLAGGLEFLRVMLSKEIYADFSELTSSMTILQDTIPRMPSAPPRSPTSTQS